MVTLAALILGLLAGVSCAPEGTADVQRPPEVEASRLEVADSAGNLVGVHSPNLDSSGIQRMQQAFDQKGGWTTSVYYSTDWDWLGGPGHGHIGDIQRAQGAGFQHVIRLDYARGTTVPLPGQTRQCPNRQGGPARATPAGTHLDCFLQYIDDLARGAGQSARVWIIGNEMNIRYEAEMFLDAGHSDISADWYVSVYEAARERIHSIPGHENDLVLVGGVSPSTDCASNGGLPACLHSGQSYLQQLLNRLDPAETDGFAIHAYGGWADINRNGGVSALEQFESGRDFIMGYREQVQMIDRAGFQNADVLISEFSAHVNLPGYTEKAEWERSASDIDWSRFDVAEAQQAADFIEGAYAGIHDWNQGGNHPILGAVWFTWNQPKFLDESLATFDETESAFKDVARREYAPGAAGEDPPGQDDGGQQPPPGDSSECDWGDVPQNQWRTCIWDISGNDNHYVETRYLDDIDHDWGRGGIAGRTDKFMLMAAGSFYFEPGTYEFTTVSDDGVRLDVGYDGTPEIENWTVHAAARDRSGPIQLSGWVNLHLQYYELEGNAQIALDFERTDSGEGGTSGDRYCSDPAIDNCCNYEPNTAGVPATQPGGICDPNGNGQFEDAQWGEGWYCHRDRCSSVSSEPNPESSFPCDTSGQIDNCCSYDPGTEGVPATHPGGICDPDGDGAYEDADWGAGWQCYTDACK
jgi:hypothetical protein